MNGLVSYMNELQRISVYWGIITLILFGIFLGLWLYEPRRLVNGITFIIFFISFLV